MVDLPAPRRPDDRHGPTRRHLERHALEKSGGDYRNPNRTSSNATRRPLHPKVRGAGLVGYLRLDVHQVEQLLDVYRRLP